MTAEQLNLYERLNDTVCEQETENVVVRFEHQVRLHPNKLAVAGTRNTLRYKDLNENANRVAHALRNEGIGREDLIMVMMPRVPDYYAANLGILKAGAAYLPVSPEDPDERICGIFAEAGCRTAITTRSIALQKPDLMNRLPKKPLFLEDLETFGQTANPDTVILPEDLAYCIYTSGSTGKPKGVMIEHGNLSNLLMPSPKNLEVGSLAERGSAILASAAMTFDVSVMEEFAGLCNGMTVVMATEEEILNPLLLKSLMDRYGVDAICCTPSWLSTLLSVSVLRSALARIRIFDMGAEAFPGELYDRIREVSPDGMVINTYGPTEATVACIATEITSSREIPIGQPEANVQCYILGKDGEILPPGEIGELLLCGRNIGRGYRNPENGDMGGFTLFRGERAYRTGDLACLNDNAQIEYHGRLDSQIKLKGFRIEPGEVENVMSRCPLIKMCAAAPIENRYLCLYYSLREEMKPPEEAEKEIRTFAKDHLVPYMVPDFYVRMDPMPVTSSWKIDRKKLPKPVIQATAGRAPETELQKNILSCIEGVLPGYSPGTDVDLTQEGISSLDWIILFGTFADRFGIMLNIADIQRCKTILGLEKHILENPNNRMNGEVREARATLAQGIYYHLGRLPGLAETVMAVALRMDPDIETDAITDAVRRAAAVHPGLFARFEEREGEVFILAPESVEDAARQLSVEIIRTAEDKLPEVCAGFSLEQIPPDSETGFRFVICETEASKTLLSSFSHVLGDAVAVSVLLDDILRALDGREIKEEYMNIFQIAREMEQLQQTEGGDKSHRRPKARYAELLSHAVWPKLLTGPCKAVGGTIYGMKVLPLSRQAIASVCRELNVSGTLFFAGLTVLALSGRTARGGRVPLLVANNGRMDSRVTHTFGFLVRPVIICPNTDPTVSAAAFFQEISGQYFEGLCQHDLPFDEIYAHYPQWTDHLFLYQENSGVHTVFDKAVEEEWLETEQEDLPEADAIRENEAGSIPEQMALRWARCQIFYEIYEGNDEIHLAVGANRDAVPENLPQEIAEDIARICRRLSENRNVLLGELMIGGDMIQV
jgi:amino acid adenylation domain-containing protein